MKIPMFQVDAFTDRVFGGNPAAVCVLGGWLPDQVMLNIAAENNLSETAFLKEREDGFDLRWFTPKAEIDLAGHPTLAAAYTVFEILKPGWERVLFHSPSGPLTVVKEDGFLSMDFPSRPGRPCGVPAELVQGLGAEPRELLLARDHLAVFETQDQVLALKPDFNALARLESMGVIVTAPGEDRDFVSRFFAPQDGHSRGPGHRLGPLHPGALLVRAVGEKRAFRPPGLGAGRGAEVPGPGGTGDPGRAGGPVSGRIHPDLIRPGLKATEIKGIEP